MQAHKAACFLLFCFTGKMDSMDVALASTSNGDFLNSGFVAEMGHSKRSAFLRRYIALYVSLSDLGALAHNLCWDPQILSRLEAGKFGGLQDLRRYSKVFGLKGND